MITIHKAKSLQLSIIVFTALTMASASADFPAQFELSSLNGSNGFVLNGVSAGDKAGRSVSTVGDINGDGIDDLIIGAPDVTSGGSFAGACYVVFGTDQGFTSPINLSGLNGTNGFIINGESIFDSAGTSVSAAGDINNDGINDLLIGAPLTSHDADFSGTAYVVFGSDQGFSSPLSLGSLDGNDGFAINGVGADDEAATWVSGAGDVNGDNIDDLIAGAPFAGNGTAYVVFGSDEGFSASMTLADLDGTNGFAINGVGTGDSAGTSVSAGDIDGDGLNDLIIGAPLAGTFDAYAGAAYVVFGTNLGFSASLDLSSLNGSSGFVIKGISNLELAGESVSVAGDINADGIDDLIIGAPEADPNGDASGASYVVFGNDQAWSTPFELSSLNGSNGFAINGVGAGDASGSSVGAAGDINGDGFDDLVVGAPLDDPNTDASGAAFVVFGTDQGFNASLELSALNGSNGFVLNGVASGDNAGRSVNSAGDLNHDGYDDLVIGAPLADPYGASSGETYVVYGGSPVDENLIFADGFE